MTPACWQILDLAEDAAGLFQVGRLAAAAVQLGLVQAGAQVVDTLGPQHPGIQHPFQDCQRFIEPAFIRQQVHAAEFDERRLQRILRVHVLVSLPLVIAGGPEIAALDGDDGQQGIGKSRLSQAAQRKLQRLLGQRESLVQVHRAAPEVFDHHQPGRFPDGAEQRLQVALLAGQPAVFCQPGERGVQVAAQPVQRRLEAVELQGALHVVGDRQQHLADLRQPLLDAVEPRRSSSTVMALMRENTSSETTPRWRHSSAARMKCP